MSPVVERYVAVARVGDVPEGGVKVVRIEDQAIAVFLIDGKYYALDDVCTHDGGPLAEGAIEGMEIECPRHGARFDLLTGVAKTLPAIFPVNAYPVRISGGSVEVDIAAATRELEIG